MSLSLLAGMTVIIAFHNTDLNIYESFPLISSGVAETLVWYPASLCVRKDRVGEAGNQTTETLGVVDFLRALVFSGSK